VVDTEPNKPQQLSGVSEVPPDRRDLLVAVACLSLIGTVAWFAGSTVAVRRFNRLLQFARPAPAALQTEVLDLAHRFGLAKVPGLWLVPGTVSPMLWAVGRARLLFPAELLGQLDATQRATLFAHELAHYRRRDHWLRWLELLVLGLYWWHPVAWWARRELREAEEQCCDAWVMWALATDRAYATALVQTVTFLSHAHGRLPAAASGLGHIRNLRRRLTMIMSGSTAKSMSWLGVLVVLAFGGFWLSLAPAQSRPKIAAEEEEQVRPADEIELKIAEVKKMLRDLEEQRGRPGGRTEKKASDEDIAKARRLVEDHAKQLEAKQKELLSAQVDYKKALDNLTRLGGAEASQDFMRRNPISPANVFYARPATASVAPRAATRSALQPATAAPASPATEPLYRPGLAPQPALAGPVAAVPTLPRKTLSGDAESTAKAIDRLSQQLERLAKDLDELRKSMKRESWEPESR
jgi:beta-lactamase regulating signal transducer with metallopeptidase domain